MVRATRPSAEKTRQTILKSATKLFAKKGFSGASISDIAKDAKINQSLIYHHYASKEGLWKAVRFAITKRFRFTPLAADQDLKTEKTSWDSIRYIFYG